MKRIKHQLSRIGKRVLAIALCSLLSALCSDLMAAPAAATKKKAAPAKSTKSAKPASPAKAPPAPATDHAPAPAAAKAPAPLKQGKEGEFEQNIVGQRKDRMTVGKIDPPAAFNLEDIQNFPEDRLHPVLNNPITFEEGRDFSSMMDSQDEQIFHPWLPEIVKAPYLTMKPVLEKPAKNWAFSIIDQGGNPVAKQEGKGNPPSFFSWSGEDKVRGHVAVDTVYIPQLTTTDKDGYRHTDSGQPSQFASILTVDKGRQIIEVSSKRLFLDKKSDLSKEAPVFLDKVTDAIREDGRLPFAIQAFDADLDLGRARAQTLVKYFTEKLYIPASQITVLEPVTSEKRGLAMAITLNGTPGGAE